MSFPFPTWFLGVCAGCVAIPLSMGSMSLRAQPDKSLPHCKPKLVTEFTSAAPGSTTWIGVSFDIDKGWHTYWDGAGDTGVPVTIALQLPPGVKAGDPQWPAPHRYVAEGDILDYIYEGRVTALIPLTIPADAKPGSELKLGVQLTWLECKENCFPRKGDISTTIRVAEPSGKSDRSGDAARFDEARSRLPKPQEEGEKVVSRKWEGGDHPHRLILTCPGAAGLVFYPQSRCAPMSDAVRQGESKQDQLTLDFKDKDGRISPVIGIVEVKRPEKKPSEFYWLNVQGPTPKATPSNVKTPPPSQPKR